MPRRRPHRSGSASNSWPTNLSAVRSLRFLPGVQATERGLEIAFGIDQEVRGDDDLVVFSEPFLDLDAASAAPPELDFARFKTAVTLIEKHNLPLAAVDNGAAGYGNDRSIRSCADFDIGIHVGPQRFVRVRQLDSYSPGPCLRHQGRIDQRDFPDERTVWIGARTLGDLLP